MGADLTFDLWMLSGRPTCLSPKDMVKNNNIPSALKFILHIKKLVFTLPLNITSNF